jgi:hypothetical protein
VKKIYLEEGYHIDWLDGNVALSAVPGRDDLFRGWLENKEVDFALKHIKGSGIGVVVTLMEKNELVNAGIGDLGERIQDLGIEWLHFPIKDGRIPGRGLPALMVKILDAILDGKKVLIHCRGGWGRTGTVAGCYLASLGHTFDYIIHELHATRGAMCPETVEQMRYIAAYMSAVQERRANV